MKYLLILLLTATTLGATPTKEYTRTPTGARVTIHEPRSEVGAWRYEVESSPDLSTWTACTPTKTTVTKAETTIVYDIVGGRSSFARVFMLPAGGYVMVGDSLTAGINGPTKNIAAKLAALTGQPCKALGYSGQGTPLITDHWVGETTHHSKVAIFWPGNNDGQMNRFTPHLDTLVGQLTSPVKRFLFISPTDRAPWDWEISQEGRSFEDWTLIRPQQRSHLAEKYPDNYLDIETLIETTYPTTMPGDEIDISRGINPRSMKADRNDGDNRDNDNSHYSEVGDTFIANLIYKELVARGWAR